MLKITRCFVFPSHLNKVHRCTMYNALNFYLLVLYILGMKNTSSKLISSLCIPKGGIYQFSVQYVMALFVHFWSFSETRDLSCVSIFTPILVKMQVHKNKNANLGQCVRIFSWKSRERASSELISTQYPEVEFTSFPCNV